jgi:hypothetical protein
MVVGEPDIIDQADEGEVFPWWKQQMTRTDQQSVVSIKPGGSIRIEGVPYGQLDNLHLVS